MAETSRQNNKPTKSKRGKEKQAAPKDNDPSKEEEQDSSAEGTTVTTPPQLGWVQLWYEPIGDKTEAGMRFAPLHYYSDGMQLVPFEQAQEMLAIEPRPLRETAPRNERRRTSKEQSFAPCRSHPEGRAARMESKEQSSAPCRSLPEGRAAFREVQPHRHDGLRRGGGAPHLRGSAGHGPPPAPVQHRGLANVLPVEHKCKACRWTSRRTASGSATPWGPSGTPSSPTRPSGSPRALLGTCGSQRELRRAGLPDPARLQPGLLPPGRGGVAFSALFLELAPARSAQLRGTGRFRREVFGPR